jgi:hypothetical protein
MGTKANLERPIEATWLEWVTPEDDGEEDGERCDVGPDDGDDDSDD